MFCICLIDLSRRELGYCLGSLRNSVLCKLSWKHKTNSGLDLAGRKSCLLVVGSKLSCLSSDTLKDIVDEGVHDGHTLLGDSSIWVYLLQYLVDVGGVGFNTLLGSLFSSSCLLWCLCTLLGWGLCHFEISR